MNSRHAQAALLALDDLRLELAERAEAHGVLAHERDEATEQLVDREAHRAVLDARVRAEETVDRGLDRRGAGLALDAAVGDEHDGGLAHERARVLDVLLADERVDVRERDAQLRGHVVLERAQLVLEGAAAAVLVEERGEAAAHAVGRRAGDEAHLLGGELLDEVARGGGEIAATGRERELLGARSDGRLELGGERGLRAGLRGLGAEATEAPTARVQHLARVGVERCPVERGERARVGREAKEPGGGAERDELLEDLRGVGVVDAALVALVEAILRVGADHLDELGAVAGGVGERLDGEAALPVLGVEEHACCKEFAAIDVGRLRDERLLPEVLRAREALVLDRPRSSRCR